MPPFTASALLHLLLLAAAILLARQHIEAPEQPEWVPPTTMRMIFQGGAPKHPEIAAPKPTPAHKLPESAPAAPRPALPPLPTPPPLAPPAPITPPPAVQAPKQAPKVAVQPPLPAPAPPRPKPQPAAPEIEALPLPPPPAPAQARRAPPRHLAFPAPMAFSFGPAARAPSRPAPGSFGHGIDISLGQGVLGSADTKIFGRGDSKYVGPDWYNEFEAWWERHSYYPPQAGLNGEQGDVTLDLVVRRDGEVQSVRLAVPSGWQWLDMAALAVFRGAHLPPLTSDNAATVPLHLTIHYVIVRR